MRTLVSQALRRALRHWRTGALAGLLCGIVPTCAWADPVVITFGAFRLDFEGPAFGFLGDDFRLFGAGQLLEFGDLTGLTNICAKCEPGDEIVLSGATQGMPMLGFGRLGPGPLSEANVRVFASLRFDAPSRIAPPVPGDSVVDGEVQAPFSMTGSLAMRSLDNTREVRSVDIVGRGIAHGFLENHGTNWGGEHQFVQYEFLGANATNPTPEPASLLLLGTGIAGVVARKRLTRGEPPR
jgi:hypothetical protein